MIYFGARHLIRNKGVSENPMASKEEECIHEGGHFWHRLGDVYILPTGEKVFRQASIADGPKCKRCGKYSSTPCSRFHRWNGCYCAKCGLRRPAEARGHRWDGCTCSSCGISKRVEAVEHKWDGCRCSSCFTVRDEQHKWNGCECSICNKKRHEWKFLNKTPSAGLGCCPHNHYRCSKCGKERDEPLVGQI